ncbi:MAG TPA: PHB depolymerase family esterase [Lysobacter sp.]
MATASARPKATASLQSQIGKTINDALVAAGLSLKSPSPSADVAGVAPAEVEQKGNTVPPGRTATPVSLPGTFVEHSFAHAAGKRRYKLYVPARYRADAATPWPLLLMLHGCTQSPDDFAAGTRMNELAEQHGFLVAYPAQSANANGSRCWNWFRPGDQTRARGEPALLAALTREVVQRHAIDPRRVYVAGLSAGAAMAVILGATHPDVFAAVGSHSGLPYRAAHDVPSAFAAMAGNYPPPAGHDKPAQAPHPGAPPHATPVVPLIAFQGDGDRTVAASNADALVRQALGAAAGIEQDKQVSNGEDNGRSYTRTVYRTRLGDPLVEFWQLHGAGHAWSGGSAEGSYTDAQGPDASSEMMRFFLQLPGRRHQGD